MDTKKPRFLGARSADLDALCAADIMQHELVTVRASDPICEVERMLAGARVSGAPVLDDNERVIGVISSTDLVGHRADDDGEEPFAAGEIDDGGDETETVAFRRPDRSGTCAGDIMTPEITSVQKAASLREVARTMVEQQVHRVLVNDHDRLVGLVSTMDVLRAIAK